MRSNSSGSARSAGQTFVARTRFVIVQLTPSGPARRDAMGDLDDASTDRRGGAVLGPAIQRSGRPTPAPHDC